MADQDLIRTVRGWVSQASRIVALTGAGISTDSGIPDFRGPQGVWTKDPVAEKQSNIDTYMADEQVRIQSWRSRLNHAAWTARPNAGHHALVDLEKQGKLHALITQNIDELHQVAGNTPARVIEVHGTVRRVVCMACGLRTPMPEVLERVKAGEADPRCLSCSGIQKSDTISFGQALVPAVIDRALTVAGQADLLLAIGSTLQVFPVAEAVPIAARAGARIVIINAEPTAMDELADAVLRGSISELLPQVCRPDKPG